MRIAISGSFERQARNALHSATSHPSNFLLEATPSQEPPCHVARSCSSFTDHLKFFIVARRRRTGAAVARNSSMVRSQCSPVTVADRKAPFVVRCPNASQRAPPPPPSPPPERSKKERVGRACGRGGTPTGEHWLVSEI